MTGERTTARRLFLASIRIAVAILIASATWWFSGAFVEQVSWSRYKLELAAASDSAKSYSSSYAPASVIGENLRRVWCLPNVDIPSSPPAAIQTVPFNCYVLVSGPSDNIEAHGAALAKAKAWIYQVTSPVPGYSPEVFEFRFSVDSVVAWTSIPSELLASAVLILICLLLAWSIGFRPVRMEPSVFWSSRLTLGNLLLTLLPIALVFATVIIFDAGTLKLTGPVSGVSLLTVVLLRPVAEELFYRVWMIEWLGYEMPKWLAIGISTGLFYIGHDPSSALSSATLVVSGALFGWLWIRSRSLVLCVIAHGGVNAIITLF